MKKSTLIITVVIIMTVVLSVWGYFLLYGTPKTVTDVFTNFGFGVNENLIYEPTIDSPNTSNSGESLEALRQLTINPVAGAVVIGNNARYVEKGTGHIFEINVSTKAEQLISGTVIPLTRTAVFSADGSGVAITTGERAEEVVVGQLTGGGAGLVPVALPEGSYAVGFSASSSVVNYLLPEGEGASAFSYGLASRSSNRLFSIPFREARVLWGSPTYLYTTPSAAAKGYLYRLNNKDLQFVTTGDYALMPIPVADSLILTRRSNNTLVSSIITAGATPLATSLLTEKCVAHPIELNLVFCASPEAPITGNQPDNWYMGKQSFSDNLYVIDIQTGSINTLSNLLVTSGREIDVHSIGISADGHYLYFTNKNDGTLWVFDTAL